MRSAEAAIYPISGGGSWRWVGSISNDNLEATSQGVHERYGIDASTACSEIAKRLSTTLHREYVRAISRRLSLNVFEEEACNTAAWMAEEREE